MNLVTELYVEQVTRWPREGRHILAHHDGSATALLTLASGFLYTWLEGQAFFAMAALCGVAVPLAARMMR
jgi:hypothetical protein